MLYVLSMNSLILFTWKSKTSAVEARVLKLSAYPLIFVTNPQLGGAISSS
jgi:hypothetical protein